MDRHAEVFQSLADPTRLRLLNLFQRAGAICVCELTDALQIPQYNISRHLHVLLSAGLLEDRKCGKWTYYCIARELKPYHRALLRAIGELHEERQDFQDDEARAARRLKLRRDGICCVGLVQKIGAALTRKNKPGAATL